jgi:tetratricopeptide (TPR) repeat protein
MRPFFAFLGLLFCLTPIRADEQAVIKDSDAIRYVGRYVEVRGVVVSVKTSPLGTAFINFGREYPDQTFAGFVAADSNMPTDQLATLQGKIIGTVAESLNNLAGLYQAQGQYAKAEPLYKRALVILEKEQHPDGSVAKI